VTKKGYLSESDEIQENHSIGFTAALKK